MAIWSILGNAVKAAIGPVTTVVDGWQQRKTAKLDSDLAINTATTASRIKKLETGQAADIAWEQTSLEQAGWKDEFWTIIIAIPMVMCFLPTMVPWVVAGFAALNTTPLWYQSLVGIAVGSAFGVRRVQSFMKTKKGD